MLAARFQLDVRPNHEIIAILTGEKKVEVQHDGIQTMESYDVLLLSPEAKPFVPPITGLAEAKNVFIVRNVSDIDKIIYQWCISKGHKYSFASVALSFERIR